MVSLLAAARGIVARRTAHDWLIAAAASLIILLATTLLSAGVIYSGAVSESGLRNARRRASDNSSPTGECVTSVQLT